MVPCTKEILQSKVKARSCSHLVNSSSYCCQLKKFRSVLGRSQLFVFCKNLCFGEESSRKKNEKPKAYKRLESHKTGELCSAGIKKPLLRITTTSDRSPQGTSQSTAPLTRSTCEVLMARPRRGSRKREGANSTREAPKERPRLRCGLVAKEDRE